MAYEKKIAVTYLFKGYMTLEETVRLKELLKEQYDTERVLVITDDKLKESSLVITEI